MQREKVLRVQNSCRFTENSKIIIEECVNWMIWWNVPFVLPASIFAAHVVKVNILKFLQKLLITETTAETFLF